MKKYRPLIIAAIVLAVILAAYLLIVALVPAQNADTSTNDDTERVEYVLASYEMADVDYMQFTFEDGYEYVIDCVVTKDEDNITSRNYFIKGKEQYEFDRSLLGMAAMSLCDITMTSYVEENPKDLVKYGLDTPYVRYEIVDNDGNNSVILIGDPAPVGSGCYAMEEGGDKVYLIGSYISKYLLAKDQYYRVLSFTNYEDYTFVKRLLVTQPDKDTVEIDSHTSEEKEAMGMYSTQYNFKQPVERAANDEAVAEEILANAIAISAVEVVEDSVADLAKYGLTEDVSVIEIEDINGATRKLTLSKAEDGYRYGVITGIMSVYKFSDAVLSPLFNIDYRSYINKLVWLHTITDIGLVEMNLNGEKHTLEIYAPDVTEEEEGKEFSATYDGGEISEENARRLYAKVLSPTFYDMIEGEYEAGEIEYEFKIVYDQTGAEHVLQFAPINDRQYVAYLNGQATDFYVNVTDLTAIGKAIDMIESGETLPM